MERHAGMNRGASQSGGRAESTSISARRAIGRFVLWCDSAADDDASALPDRRLNHERCTMSSISRTPIRTAISSTARWSATPALVTPTIPRSRPARSPSAWSSAARPSISTSSSTASRRCWCSRRCSSRSPSRLEGTLYSFVVFSFAFIARPIGTIAVHGDPAPLRPRRQADDGAVPARHLHRRHRLPAGLREHRLRLRSCCCRSSASARASRSAARGTACRRCWR